MDFRGCKIFHTIFQGFLGCSKVFWDVPRFYPRDLQGFRRFSWFDLWLSGFSWLHWGWGDRDGLQGFTPQDRMDFHLLLRMVWDLKLPSQWLLNDWQVDQNVPVTCHLICDYFNWFFPNILSVLSLKKLLRMNRSTPSLPSNMPRSSTTRGQRIASS